jgi:hypothetical protein
VSEVRSNNKASHLAERARERPERWSSSSQLPAREARIHSSTYHHQTPICSHYQHLHAYRISHSTKPFPKPVNPHKTTAGRLPGTTNRS